MKHTDEAFDNVLVDLFHKELRNTKRVLTILIIVTILLVLSLGCNAWLLYERLQYTLVTETTRTEESYDYDIEGDGNEIVNGDQYNDRVIYNNRNGGDE